MKYSLVLRLMCEMVKMEMSRMEMGSMEMDSLDMGKAWQMPKEAMQTMREMGSMDIG